MNLNVSGTWAKQGNIENLKGIEFFTNLTNLNCDYNKIKVIDLNAMPNLEGLSCTNNQIIELTFAFNSKLKTLQ